MSIQVKCCFVILLIILSACASLHNGPSAMALPGTGKSFDQFRHDDTSCQQFAREQIGGTTVNNAANEGFVNSAVVGTAIGAVVGAAAGGNRGAGVGAATGLVVGSATGVNEANWSSYEFQWWYVHSHTFNACMRVDIEFQFLGAS